MALSRAQFQARKTIVREVECPELGGSVCLRELSLGDAEKRLSPILQEEGDVTAKILILLVCDPDGSPLFTDEDLDLVNALPMKVATRLAKQALDANGVDTEGVEAEVKNS